MLPVSCVLNKNQTFNFESPDSYNRSCIDYALEILFEYVSALRQVRAGGMADTQVFNNGM